VKVSPNRTKFLAKSRYCLGGLSGRSIGSNRLGGTWLGSFGIEAVASPTRRGGAVAIRVERTLLGLILATLLAVLAFRADQPIVENYVGRQIPTAMVARNLYRGSGFLHPTLDTAPFPNRFLVEPPIYAQIVAWVKADVGFVWEQLGWPPLGFVWEAAGRLTSAVMTTLGAWALFHLVRRREGPAVALAALASLGILPVTLRYGRAFQPDATMLGFVLLGMAGWDAYQAGGRRRWGWLGGLALAMGLATKITSAWILIPFGLVVTRLPIRSRVAAGLVMLVPALAWYGFAWNELRHVEAGGSRASVDNAALWAGSFAPGNWVRFATWEAVARNLFVRAFTPVGFGLASLGLAFVRPQVLADRLWLGWGIGCCSAILALGAKWHHGYYWLVLGPLAAVGIARLVGMVAMGQRWGRLGSVGLASFFLIGCTVQSATTWRTPPEWASIRESAARIAEFVPAQTALIAPEAVLYYADRPGLRLEFGPNAMRRASGEWGDPIPIDRAVADPLALVNFYARQAPGDPRTRFGPQSWRLFDRLATRYVADIGRAEEDSRRFAWRQTLRRRPSFTVLIDEPTLILARIEVWPFVAGRAPTSSNPRP